MLSMEDMEETEKYDNQQASTSMAAEIKHNKRKRSPKIHPQPEATNGPFNDRYSQQTQSTSFKRSDHPPKSSDSSKFDSPPKDSGSSKDGRSSSKHFVCVDSGSRMNTHDDKQTVSSQDRLFECAKNGDVAGIKNLKLKSKKDDDAETEEVSESDKVYVDVKDKDGLTALHLAARAHNHAAVQVLLENSAGVNKKSGSFLTPLMYACRNEPTLNSEHSIHEQVSTVKELLTHGASLTDTDRDGFNALHHCALRGPLEICKLLIEKEDKGKIINARTKQGLTPLCIAIMQWDVVILGTNRRNIVEYILNNAEVTDKDENKSTALHIAVMKGNVEAAELLLKSEKFDVDCENEDGNTPLMLASKYGNEELMHRLIVENKCKIDRNNKNGMTALHYAALYGKTNAIVKLLRHGPKQLANKVTSNKKTAFHLACENNNLECAKELQAGKCAQDTLDANGLTPFMTPDANGFTPFMHAVAKGFTELVHNLMDCGDIDPCVRLGDGRNILHIVAEKNRSTVLKILFDKTSKDTLQRERTAQMSSINKMQKLLNAQDNETNKTTPLHTASQFGHVKVFEILLKYGANPFLPDAEMKTPLHIASEKGFTSIIENMALQNHEFLDKTDGNGDTVYHLAAKEGHARLLDVLLREDKENIVSSKNKKGCTPLWLATASGHLKCVEHLCTQTDLIDMANESKLTPLMVASKNGHADVVEYLIKKDANVSALDQKGHNCLEIAILNHHKSVAMAIIESNQWEKALRNYTKDDDGMECTPFRKLVRHMPDTAKASLDRCIYSSAEENGTKRQKKDHACKNERKDKRTEYLARFNFEFIDDLYFITEWEDKSSFRTRDMEATKTQYSYKRTDTPEAYENDADLFKVQHPMIIMLIQLFMRRLNYFNFVNIMEIIIFVTSFLFVIDFDGCQYYTNYRYTFQWNLGAVSILLSWFGIVMYLQKWPDIGIYVVMFNNILRTLVKFFIVSVLFIVGFGLGFFCLLQNQTPFSTAPYAILRTTVMMIGELDFNAVFHDDVVHYWITYVFFCIFLIVMTIVIMNLMIGLAINDIKAVQDHATLKGIQMKVKLVLDVERLLLSVSKYRLGGYWIWPPGWYIDVYVKRFKSAEYMKIALSKDADKYENQVEVNQHKMMHKQKTLKKAMKTMNIEIDKQGVLLEEIKRKLFEETKT